MNNQLALKLQLNDEVTFTDFCWDGNQLLKFHLEQSLKGCGEQFIYIWGPKGSGKSSLLKASCNEMAKDHSAIFLPLDILKEFSPEVLSDIESQELICIDNIDAITNLRNWEEALFHLYNRIRDNKHTILFITGSVPPSQLPFSLRDLQSRMTWGLVLQLIELEDREKIKILSNLAKKRGFILPNHVGQFLLNRCARSMHELYCALDRLDSASLSAKRKITIPFAKRILGI